jgi:hypothetical protein
MSTIRLSSRLIMQSVYTLPQAQEICYQVRRQKLHAFTRSVWRG